MTAGNLGGAPVSRNRIYDPSAAGTGHSGLHIPEILRRPGSYVGERLRLTWGQVRQIWRKPNMVTHAHSSEINGADLSKIVFFICGVRSGSTVCRRMLATNQRVRDVGEIFNSDNPEGYYRFCAKSIRNDASLLFPENVRKLFCLYLKSLEIDDRLVLVDIKYEHLGLLSEAWQPPFTKPVIVKWIEDLPCKVIHLRRKTFTSVVSNLIAIETGVYHLGRQEARVSSLTGICLNRSALIDAISARTKIREFVEHSFPADRMFSLDYESMFSSDSVFEPGVRTGFAHFLGIDDDFQPIASLRKVIDKPLMEVVANYPEIADLQTL
jgi:hypothetical protein